MADNTTEQASSAAQQQQQLRKQQQQQQRRNKLENLFANFTLQYPFNIVFPAKVVPKDKKKYKSGVKTSKDLINARLLENGILFEDLQTIPQVVPGIARLIDNLQRTGCFNSVQVQLARYKDSDNDDDDETNDDNVDLTNLHQLNVILDEKNWYKLYIGGGFKQEGIEEAMSQGIGSGGVGGEGNFPKAQFETSATFLNLTGHLDQSIVRYTVDQTSVSSLLLSHERPLYSWFNGTTTNGGIGDTILALERGSQYSLGLQALLNTVDYEWTRSYKEHQHILSCKLDNVGGVTQSELAPTDSNTNNYFWSLDWSLSLRDIVPRRHSTIPYAIDASPEVVTLSGPSVTNSLTWEIRTNGSQLNTKNSSSDGATINENEHEHNKHLAQYQPTSGWDGHAKVQLAGPPGDVGFMKAQGGYSFHKPIRFDDDSSSNNTTMIDPTSASSSPPQPKSSPPIALHCALSSGLLYPLTYNGNCRPPILSDRFFVGGPMQLRGFLPAGIGPRATTGGSTVPGGDALGGTFFYTATIAASILPPLSLLQTISSSFGGGSDGIRMFAFTNAGTVTDTSKRSTKHDIKSISTILNSSRISIGLGMSMATPMGRLETTYAWPIRYGPRDARRNVQFGFGFNFG